MLVAILAASSARAPLRAPHFRAPLHAPPRTSPRMGEAPWCDEEDWALIDSMPEFTVGSGSMTATFWTALSSSNAVLCQRSPSECERRARLLTAENASLNFGGEPMVLCGWTRLANGRFTGRLDDRTVWLTVDVEGRLASDPRSGAGYIETIGGRVYELGEPAAAGIVSMTDLPIVSTEKAGRGGEGLGEELEQWGLLKGVVKRLQLSPQAERSVPLLLSFALVGGLCFQLGASGLPQQAAVPAPLAASGQAAPQAALPPARASLTVSEQKARQAIRVAADQMALDQLRAEARKANDQAAYDQRLESLKRQLKIEENRVVSYKESIENEIRETLRRQFRFEDQRQSLYFIFRTQPIMIAAPTAQPGNQP